LGQSYPQAEKEMNMNQSQNKFFHILDLDGKIDKQGMVVHRNHTSCHATVQFFSWIDGLPNGRQTFAESEMRNWRFYQSKSAWLKAGDRVFA
jgi:hypothetical protein